LSQLSEWRQFLHPGHRKVNPVSGDLGEWKRKRSELKDAEGAGIFRQSFGKDEAR
jgi:hypothetical protein